jgi:hypothetical protein
MGDIIEFPGGTRGPVSVDSVLDGARERDLYTTIVVGLTEDDDLYFASSSGDLSLIVWLLERCKLKTLQYGEE